MDTDVILGIGILGLGTYAVLRGAGSNTPVVSGGGGSGGSGMFLIPLGQTKKGSNFPAEKGISEGARGTYGEPVTTTTTTKRTTYPDVVSSYNEWKAGLNNSSNGSGGSSSSSGLTKKQTQTISSYETPEEKAERLGTYTYTENGTKKAYVPSPFFSTPQVSTSPSAPTPTYTRAPKQSFWSGVKNASYNFFTRWF